MKRIGVVTAGGDAPGLNAALRAIGRSALESGDEVVGILNGWTGLLSPRATGSCAHRTTPASSHSAGTILGGSRTAPLNDEDALHRLVAGTESLRLDALIAIGGDGTLSLARRLAEHGVRMVGVPKTIDFDVDTTEVCIGFDSALATVSSALDHLHTTAASHHRVMVLETMGRDSGWLAALGGLAGGADVVCIPEFEISLDEIAERLVARRRPASCRRSSRSPRAPDPRHRRACGAAGRVRPPAARATGHRRARGRGDGAAHRQRVEGNRARLPPARRVARRDRQGLGGSARRGSGAARARGRA